MPAGMQSLRRLARSESASRESGRADESAESDTLRENSTAGIVHRAFHELQQESDANVVQKQTANHHVHAAVVLQTGSERDPSATGGSARQCHRHQA